MEDWTGASVWRMRRTAEEGQRDLGRRMWRTGRGQVSGEWDEQQRKVKEILGEGCGGLDGGKCLESGTNSRGRSKKSWEKDVEDWMGASVGEWDEQQRKAKEILGEGCGGLDGGKCWRVGRTAEEGQRDLGRRMWRTGWGQVSGEWDEQQRKAKEILGEGCGGLDGGQVSGEGWDHQQKIG